MITLLVTGYLTVMLVIVVALCLAARRPAPDISTASKLEFLTEEKMAQMDSPVARRRAAATTTSEPVTFGA
jgi:hypothetical protein